MTSFSCAQVLFQKADVRFQLYFTLLSVTLSAGTFEIRNYVLSPALATLRRHVTAILKTYDLLA